MINRRQLTTGLLAGAALLPTPWLHAATHYQAGDTGNHLDNTLKETLAALVDSIIPATDTPGALDAGVLDFIDYVLTYGRAREQAEAFGIGLADLAATCVERTGSSLTALPSTLREALLTDLEQSEAGKPLGGFLVLAKALTVMGFCTSQMGATQALEYLAIPGPYQGCIELTKEQRTWAT